MARLQFSIRVDGVSEESLVVRSYQGQDNFSSVQQTNGTWCHGFRYQIELASRRPDLTALDMVDKNAELVMHRDGEVVQRINGIVRNFTQGETGHHHTFYSLTLVPEIERLSLRHKSRIFQSISAPDIIATLFKEMDIQDFAFALTRTPKQREFCMQYRETEPSDANFYLYQFYNQDHGDEEKAEVYFEQALKAEQPLAMYEQAVNLQKGEGFYFFQSNRFEDMNEWLIKAANKGYIPAYRQLIKNYELNDDYKTAYQWRVKLLQQGDLLSLASMGNILLGHSAEGYDEFIDTRLSLEYLSLYLTFAGQDRMGSTHDEAKDNYDRAFETLTEAKRKQHETLTTSQLDSVKFVYVDRYFVINFE